MSDSPVISFGLCVTTAAMKAKCGQCGLRDRIDLAVAALRQVPHDEEACHAVAEFLATVELAPANAAEKLQAFLSDWLDRVSPREAEVVLAGSDAVDLFAWQRRADING
ncbi:hypothetical protein [Pacificoceanicola onchidii]|uniref:hypothetical protein n=1 Tax=Pacificoceanicola onchidii TaxID=2562685 RepID=UPI0010A2B349|nr:hypothetical protein [Pacificoceanicola onchidii]